MKDMFKNTTQVSSRKVSFCFTNFFFFQEVSFLQRWGKVRVKITFYQKFELKISWTI